MIETVIAVLALLFLLALFIAPLYIYWRSSKEKSDK